MNALRSMVLCGVASLAGVLLLVAWAGAQAPEASKSGRKQNDKPTAESRRPLAVAQARERAKLLHEVYDSALHAIHSDFFREGQAAIPARTLEYVFDQVARKSNVKARWFSVNAKAMSIHHKPRDDFEKKAAEVLGSGKPEYELVEAGQYRRAGPIVLSGGCTHCHTSQRSNPVVGLAITMPVVSE